MREETTKQWLKRYADACRREEIAKEKLRTVESDFGLSSPALSDMPKGSKSTSDLSTKVALIDGLVLELIKRENEKAVIFAEISEAIGNLDDKVEQMVLTYRYLSRYKWEYISEKLGYDASWVARIHKRALQNIKINTH